MSENSKSVNSVEKKEGFFKSLKKEFNKIMWPDRSSTTSKSIAVVAVTAALAVVIALLDVLIEMVLTQLG